MPLPISLSPSCCRWFFLTSTLPTTLLVISLFYHYKRWRQSQSQSHPPIIIKPIDTAEERKKQMQVYFSKFSNELRFGMDIGGTLCKVVYFEPRHVDPSIISSKDQLNAFIHSSRSTSYDGNDVHLAFYCSEVDGTFHFLKFQTAHMQQFVELVRIANLSVTDAHVVSSSTRLRSLSLTSASSISHLIRPKSTTSLDTSVFQPPPLRPQRTSPALIPHTKHYDTSISPSAAPMSIVASQSVPTSPSPATRSRIPSMNGSISISPIITSNASPIHPSPPLSPSSPTSSSHSLSVSTSSSSSSSSSSAASSTSTSTSISTPELLRSASPSPSIFATGGGAVKFSDLFRDELKVTLHTSDELAALVTGIDFMIHIYPEECYYLKKFKFKEEIEEETTHNITYPYLVVNIGSGVSILKVTSPTSWERVGGTSLGGGTFYGLCRALTGCTSFAEALQLAERGRSTADLLVGDIYGGGYDALNLSADTVASSFGRLVRSDALTDVTKSDLAKAALVMITNNIGALANLYAHKVLNVPQIVFAGNFLNNNVIARRSLAFATDFWSKGATPAVFLRHEGYFGAVGSLC